MTRSQNTLLNIGLLCATLIVFFGGIEAALRVTGIEKGHVAPPPIYRKSANPDISYELKPDMKERAFRSTVQTSHLGFRGPELTPGQPVLAVLGDSIAFGYGVEDTQSIPGQLQQMLPNWNVVNAATPGYDLVQEAATYKDKVAPLQPKALLLVFYWNDLQDMIPADLAPDGNVFPRGQVPVASTCNPVTTGLLGLIPGKCWLDTHSAFYRVLKKFIIARTGQKDLAAQREIAKTAPTEPYPEANMRTYEAQLTAFAGTLPKDLPRLFVIWPDVPLHPEYRARLRTLAQANGFTVVDLYDTFGNSPETLTWDTVHPSAKTDAKAAEIIKQALDAGKML
jgi:lysophospholipase L1-like esterase